VGSCVQAEIDDLDMLLTPLVTAAAPGLLALPGVGVETAGQLLVTAGDNRDRLRSEASSTRLRGAKRPTVGTPVDREADCDHSLATGANLPATWVQCSVGLIPGWRLVDDSQVHPHNHPRAGQHRHDLVQVLDDLFQK
jgi:hypothetical protein